MSTLCAPSKRSFLPRYDKRFGLFLALAVGALVCLLPLPAGLTPEGQKALGLFCALITLWATEPVPLPIISLLMIPACMFLGLTTMQDALNNFAVSSIYLIGGALIMAVGMSKTGLAERVIFILMARIGHTTKRITLGITLANIALAFMVPSTSARTAILLPMCLGLIDIFRNATGRKGRSNFGVSLLLILTMTNATISAGILTATIPNPVTADFIFKATGTMLSYQEWFLYGFPPALIMTFLTWWFVNFMFRPEINELPGGKEFIAGKLREKGPMTREEWLTAGIFLLVVALWMTGSITKINTTLVVLIGVCLMFAFRIITWKEANGTVAFQFMLTLGGGFLVANLLITTGAAAWAAERLFSAFRLEGASTLFTLIVVMLGVQYLHLPFMGTTKMTTMIIPIVIGVAKVADISPLVIAMPAGMIIGGYPLFLFYNTIPSLLVYNTGELKFSDFPKVGFALCTAAAILYCLTAVTYWRWLGLFAM
ncbi:MAG: DASS family sodium-coupled anion symporter [Deltaproteobacteria bacterium]|nr:DASS family sodium-coupled anion symporter [Deltaproteobacteria bacterium]